MRISLKSKRVQIAAVVLVSIILVAGVVVFLNFLHNGVEEPMVGVGATGDLVQITERTGHAGFVGFLEYTFFVDATVQNFDTVSHQAYILGFVRQGDLSVDRGMEITLGAGETRKVTITFSEVKFWSFGFIGWGVQVKDYV